MYQVSIHFRTAHPRTFKHGPTGKGHVCPRFSSGTLLFGMTYWYNLLKGPDGLDDHVQNSKQLRNYVGVIMLFHRAMLPRQIQQSNTIIKNFHDNFRRLQSVGLIRYLMLWYSVSK
jgi:hypothetical protein